MEASWLLPDSVSLVTTLLLMAVSFLSSAMSAAFGIGGGVVMLGTLANFMPAPVVIAMHGIVQLGSNSGRVAMQFRHIVWHIVFRFACGSLIGTVIGAFVVFSLPEKWMLILLGIFIILMVLISKKEIALFASLGMVIGGGVSSILSMFVGATGPFVLALLMPLKLSRFGTVACHSLCMVLQHSFKVIALSLIGVQLADYVGLLALIIFSGLIGTLVGTKLLKMLPEALFKHVVQCVLILVALRLIWSGLTIV